LTRSRVLATVAGEFPNQLSLRGSSRGGPLIDRTRTQARTQGRLPTFLIIGAAKAGTTSLAEYLSEHPQVFVAPEKEINFFDRHHRRGPDWYRSRFASAGDARAVGEASPAYMYFDDALARMAQLVPEAKLVAILRDPVERLYSDYWYRVPLGETRSFAEVVRQEIAEGKPFHKTMRMGYLEVGRYARHLRRVCEHFPRESLLILLMDDLRSDPPGTFASLCRFIGVDDGFRPPSLGQPTNEAYTLRWPALRRTMWRLRLGKRARWLAKRLDDFNRVPLTKPAMDPALGAELKAWYAADNAELAEWLGRDLTAWSS
jgi:hypothetical protein